MLLAFFGSVSEFFFLTLSYLHNRRLFFYSVVILCVFLILSVCAYENEKERVDEIS